MDKPTLVCLIDTLTPEDFVFGVELPELGPPWDVYRYKLYGRNGMLALRINEGVVDVIDLGKGVLDEDATRVLIATKMNGST